MSVDLLLQTVAQEFVRAIGLPQDGEVELRTSAGSTAIHSPCQDVYRENSEEVLPKFRSDMSKTWKLTNLRIRGWD